MLFSSSINLYHTHLGLLKPTRRSPPIEIKNFILDHNFSSSLKLCGSQREQRRNLQPLKMVLVRCMDEDSIGATFDDWGDSDGMSEGSSYILPSSGEESDVELLISADFSSTDHLGSSDGISMTSPNLVIDRKRRKIHRILPGVLINAGLIAFVVVLLLLVDWCSWRIVRLPLAPFFLTRPFLISAVLASLAGYLCVPVLDSLRIHQIFSREGPKTHSRKKGTPTLGGLFFIPIGIVTAITIVGSSSVEVFGVAVATVAFGAIGLIDDLFRFIKKRKYGLPTWIRVLLEVAVGLSFFFWLDSTNISSPYSMKMLIPLPSPVGLVSLGKLYAVLTTLCFVSMGNGINLTDGLDGLAGGTAALAFIGMSIAVLPISSDLAVFGASMAGSCIGFLVHNRYRASIFMGDTGSLALGGSLAAMAACTGMFCPLFISSGVFLLEALSVIVQISNWRDRRRWIHRRAGGRLFWMAPLHYRLELCGFKEPLIVGCAYVVSSLLSMFAGYVGLISA